MTLQKVLITVIKWLVEKHKPETFSDYDKTNVLMQGYWKGSKISDISIITLIVFWAKYVTHPVGRFFSIGLEDMKWHIC
ncbi:hypothetical protein G9A89_020104 [Geosiphon pyriformis]|nr:hypothetical protein G9A89_020104 [Geosiphon pyriformis]